MPLPEPRSPWPPPALQPALEAMSTWETWWSGDAAELASHYGNGRGASRPSQHAGGVVGALARMWWGRPSAPNEPSTKIHVPLAGDICRTSANLLFGEPFTATSDNTATTEALDELLDEGTQARLLEAAELQAALGGIYLRPVADPTISDRAWLDAVAPDMALPTWRWGKLAEVVFWRVVDQGEKVTLRHFEYHVPGYVTHALYAGEGDNVGVLVPLTAHPATEGIARAAVEQAERRDDDPGDGALLDGAVTFPTGYQRDGEPRLAACYVPNMRPTPRWRRSPLLAPFGRSDLDGLEPILDALDETYASWMRDVRLAKGRIVVGDSMLDDQGPGRGARFDPDREAFTVAPGMMPRDVPITVAQFDIRVQQHRDTAHELIVTALRRAGYALITLGEVEGGTALTATEVKAKGQLSFVTAGRKQGYWTPELEQNALPALLAYDAVVFGRPIPNLDDVTVEWPDAIAEDLGSLAETVEKLHRAEAASTLTRVKIVHPDWSDEDQRAEAKLIMKEQSAAAPLGPLDPGFVDGVERGEDEPDEGVDEQDEPSADEDEPDEDAAA